MAIDKGDVDAAKGTLWADEVVQMTARQRRVGPGGSVTTPTSIILTDKRLILINREAMGIRKDVESIPYNRIASVRLEKGIIASSVFIQVTGYVAGERGLLKPGKQEGEIDGLNNTDAKLIADYIERRLAGETPASQPGDTEAEHVHCPKCGAPNPKDALYCTHCGAKLQQ